MSIERMCLRAGVSRAGFYRHLRGLDPWDEEMLLRSEIQKIVFQHQGRYGYRRATAELRRKGMLVNHKRVARIMREDSLVGDAARLAEPSNRAPKATEIYINLANRMRLTGVNQVWVADITFIRLKREFVYLAAVLDRFSRKVVGWELESNADNAAAARSPEDGSSKPKTGTGFGTSL